MLFATRRRRRSMSAQNRAIGGVAFALVALLGTVVIRSDFGLVLAVLLVVGALLYGRRALERQLVLDHNWHALERLRTLSGIEFERHVGELYQRLGYHVELTRGGGDQGIDVIAQSPQQRLGIQCKQWSGVVGNDGVQEAIAGRAYYNCSHAAVVCTSTFTQPARDLAERANIQLIDGHAYAAMVNQFLPIGRPTGFAAWVPQGRPAIVQVALIAAAIVVVVLHFSLQALNVATPTSATTVHSYGATYSQPQTYQAAPSYVVPGSGTIKEVTFASAVEQFYDDLNQHDYTTAYALLSPSFQESAPYSKWLAGYADTIYSSPHITATTDPSVLDVVLTASERFDSGTKVTVYSGTLRGIQSSDGSWLIDSGSFRMVSRAPVAQR